MDAFSHIEAKIAEWRRKGVTPGNLKLVHDQVCEPQARKFKPGDPVKVRDDIEDYAGKVGVVLTDDGEEHWPYEVQMFGVAAADKFNAEDLDHWSPSEAKGT